MTIPADIGDWIAYEPDTGCFFYKKQTGVRLAGEQAKGSVRASGMSINLQGRKYLAHRVAWFLMTGTEPERIDHIDVNPLNNRWANLRIATASQNGANQRARRQGLKGVTLHRTGKYQASVKHQGRAYYLGLFSTEREAHAAYISKAMSLFGEFARAA